MQHNLRVHAMSAVEYVGSTGMSGAITLARCAASAPQNSRLKSSTVPLAPDDPNPCRYRIFFMSLLRMIPFICDNVHSKVIKGDGFFDAIIPAQKLLK